MTDLKGRTDFVLLINVTRANPNGDPLNGNRPRTTIDGYGEISDVCIKRKIRNRMQDLGAKIFVQSEDRSDDGCRTLKDRTNSVMSASDQKDAEKFYKTACETWLDVRTFGQVFAFKKAKDSDAQGVSIGVRGPVSINTALSVDPILLEDMQITKSVSSELKKGESRGSDTMGMKHFVDYGLYVTKGSVNVQLADKTGFNQEDLDILKKALQTLFENDESSARPSGSVEAVKLIWWQHEDKTPAVSAGKVFNSVQITPNTDNPKKYEDYQVTVSEIEECVKPEVIDLV